MDKHLYAQLHGYSSSNQKIDRICMLKNIPWELTPEELCSHAHVWCMNTITNISIDDFHHLLLFKVHKKML